MIITKNFLNLNLNLFNLLSFLLFAFVLLTTTTCEYRSLDGSGNNKNNPNAGIPESPFVRGIPPALPFYAEGNNNTLIHTPGDYNLRPQVPFTCTGAKLPDGVYPLPRCVSNLLMSKQFKDEDIFDLQKLEKYKSKRRISHMVSTLNRSRNSFAADTLFNSFN